MDYIEELELNRHDFKMVCSLLGKVLRRKAPLQVLWAYMVACVLCDELTFPQRKDGHLVGEYLDHQKRTEYVGKLCNYKEQLKKEIIRNKSLVYSIFDMIAKGEIDNQFDSVDSSRHRKMLCLIADLFKDEYKDSSLHDALIKGGLLRGEAQWLEAAMENDMAHKLQMITTLYNSSASPIDYAWAFYFAHVIKEFAENNRSGVEMLYRFFHERIVAYQPEIEAYFKNLPPNIHFQDLTYKRNPAADAWSTMIEVVEKGFRPL
jgi:hypothetical protein